MCANTVVAYTDGDWETKLEWDFIEPANSEPDNSTPWQFKNSQTFIDHEKYGHMAMVNFYAGVVTGRNLDFEKTISFIENKKPLIWEEITNPADTIDNCGRGDGLPLDAASLVELKLVIFIILTFEKLLLNIFVKYFKKKYIKFSDNTHF